MFRASLAVFCLFLLSFVHSIRFYKVTSTDNDYRIARKLGIKRSELYRLNPGVKWNRLGPGKKLVVPGHAKPGVTWIENDSDTRRLAPGPISDEGDGTRLYTIRKIDNDWVIARRLGIQRSVLYRLNPKVNWRRLKPGRKIRVPAKIQKISRNAAQRAESTPRITSNNRKIKNRYWVVRASSVQVRTRPADSAISLAKVKRGEKGTVIDYYNGWFMLKFSDSQGWVQKGHLKCVIEYEDDRVSRATTPTPLLNSSLERRMAVASPSSRGMQVVNSARRLKGIRYKWACMSRSRGFDCSGLTKYVYNKFGIKLPHFSSAQARKGKYVSRANLRAGDLVFFKTRRNRRVSHVGIYIANGKFVHASASKKVVREDYLTGYYARKFVCGRRLLKD